MRFIVDCMLGKLAKWLKILGFDTLYFSKIEDSNLIDIAKKENRVLLSRDNELIKKSKGIPTLFIKSEDWREQVEQVLSGFDIWEEINMHSRCLVCNSELKYLPKENAINLVAPFVFKHADSFALCPCCGRVFWRGTHFHDMELKIREIFKKRKDSKK
ncbi:MAG: Mut7-C RNAse domain-containing protein [Acidobacteriota bacterium]|nr:Mut7-C RNAse domain-containing protein [Acidobacteriota bacterium]